MRTWIEVGIILGLLVVNGLLAMSEMAIVSSRTARLRERAARGDLGAARALELSKDPNRFLSTVQIGITLVGILAGAFGGATLAQKLGDRFTDWGWAERWADFAAVALVVGIVTYLSLVIGELVPKRLALRNPERIASMVARPMMVVSAVASPLVGLLSASTNGVLTLLRADRPTEPQITAEEIRLILEQGTEAGILGEAEEDIVSEVLDLAKERAIGLMTPRTRVDWIDIDQPLAEQFAEIRQMPHSRFPVCRDNLDNVVGVLAIRDLWAADEVRDAAGLEAILRPAAYVPENASALQVLEMFQTSPAQLLVVVDEFGGTQGVVTVTDVTEAIVGDLRAEGPAPEPQIVERADGTYLIDGLLPLDDFKDRFELDDDLPGEADYQTIGGLVFAVLGRIPTEGETFSFGPLSFEVIDMDGNRVDKILMSSPAAED